MPSPKKFRETLDDFIIEKDVIDEMYSGYDSLVSKTDKKIKSVFFAQAITVMNKKIAPNKVKEVLEANACCKSGAREKKLKTICQRLWQSLT